MRSDARIGALSAAPVQQIRRLVHEFGGTEMCKLVGGGDVGREMRTPVAGD
jgi:hypothetical protein